MTIERVVRVPVLPQRERTGHKGTYGHVLVIGGGGNFLGAPALAATAALRGGAGLVTMALPSRVQPLIATLSPCATSAPLACTPRGDLDHAGVPEALAEAQNADVLAVGPGLSQGEPQRELVEAILAQDKPVVLDADGLNNLALVEEWPEKIRCPLVLTPHPGEMSRLTGRSVKDIQAAREVAVEDAVSQWLARMPDSKPLVLVLKGAGTIVCDGRRLYVNETGNPGMATGGAGDVLTGLIAALIGQGLAPFDAAVLGVHAHGAAGDAAAAKRGEISLIASDLNDFLPDVFRLS